MDSVKVATYYFPNFHVDPRNENIHGKGWTEWNLMKHATSRFIGHHQPKIPLWGYEDEADPEVMAKKIDVAANHGIDAFIFDWYWYEGSYLERALNDGFLKAKNIENMQFALMWANHDWRNFHPGSRETNLYPINFPWSTTKETIGSVWDYIVEHYLVHPQYWRVEGLPYFSIYAMNRFIQQMGGVNATADVLEEFRSKAQTAGLPGIHLNGIWSDVLDSNPQCSACPQSEWVTRLRMNSYTSYNNVCISKKWMTDFPRVDAASLAEHYLEICRKAQDTLPGPYYPVVTVAWDSSPRTIQSETYDSEPSYPYLPIMESNPEVFGGIVRLTLDNLRKQPKNKRIMFINAWNEWTEGSYLEPDKQYGFSLLEALKKELGKP